MADSGLLARRQATETYPDPTDDEAEPDPYFALRNGAQKASHTYGPRSGQAVSEAARQYAVLANQLPNVTAFQNDDDIGASEDETEGVPMANRYLNLHPRLLDETEGEDFSVDESEIEAATDAEIDAATDVEGIQTPVGAGHTAGKGRGKGRRRGWKWALKGTAHDPKLNKEPRDQPRTNVKRTGRRRKTLDPGHDFKAKQMRATRAFVEGRLEEALIAAREAVQANPEIFAAHSLLAEILLAQGEKQDSLAAQLSGAVTARDANNWVMVAQATLEYAGEARTEEVLQQAIFCYTQAIDLEKREEHNFEARISKMHLWMELGEFTKARRDCKQLVGLRPHDVELVRQMAELCAMTLDNYETSIARKSYEFALEQTYATIYDLSDDELGAAWSHLNIYLELVDRTATPAETIFITKRWARTLLDRGDEMFWDKYQVDDRELDSDHIRRYDVIEYQHGRASRDRAKYGDGLPLEIRIKLGIFRLKMDKEHRAEAMLHFDHLKQHRENAETLYDMFFLVAGQLAAKHEYEEAIQYFEPIKKLEGVLTDDYWMRYGTSLKALNRYEEAADCYSKAGELNALNLNARIELAHLYQNNLGDKEKAFKVVEEIIGLNKKDVLRREKLHMRPKARAPKISKRSRQADADYSAEENESSADDLAVKPVRTRKKAKKDTAGSVEPLRDEEEDGADPEESKRRKQEARRAARKSEKAEEGRRRLTKANERKMEVLESLADKIAPGYEVVERLWPSLETTTDEAVIDEWMEAALALYEIFRGVKHFFPTRDKHQQFKGFLRLEPGEAKFMNEMETWKKQLEVDEDGAGENMDFKEFYTAPKALDDNMPKDFYGISFEVWHHVFVDLALIYARRSQQAACYKIIDDGLYSANVFFHNPEILNTTQATSLCCAFIFNDSERLCFAARWFLNKSDLRSGASFQLFSAANRLSFGNNLWFSAGPTQKHMLRSVKALDHHYFPPEVRKKFDWSLQLPTLRKRVEKYGEGTGHLDPNALITYGHMVGVANHSQSALPYFFRAFALQPDNITINLSIATMYIQNAMKRQTDNRQYGVMQGLSFLYRYYDTRSRSEGMLEKQEAEFNVARTWHMLGLTHLAIASYERAMALAQAVDDENEEKNMRGEHALENFGTEAAYALMNIYAVTGNEEAAMEINEKWLVL